MPPLLLVVDDDAVMRSLEVDLLQQDGYEVEVAEDGPAALEKLETTRYAAIILDLGLPGIDGYEVARQTRQLPLNKQTPIVLVTGTSEPEAMRRGFEAGAVLFLTKPFTATTFRRTIQSVIA